APERREDRAADLEPRAERWQEPAQGDLDQERAAAAIPRQVEGLANAQDLLPVPQVVARAADQDARLEVDHHRPWPCAGVERPAEQEVSCRSGTARDPEVGRPLTGPRLNHGGDQRVLD